jgi:hypothetical protein
MTLIEKYDRLITGLISGLILPFIIGLLIYLFSSHGISPGAYLSKLVKADIVTHSISLCVFPNLVIFLIFNRLDMLKAVRGTLAITIAWAVIVFIIKFLI